MTRSALYECRITHERFGARPHRFAYDVFAFALELDELDALAARIPWFSRNRFNLFSFHDRDHHDVEELLRGRGISAKPARVLLITNARILGYVFNPVSFYFCFDEAGQALAAVAEVNNTFGESKSYVMTQSDFAEGRFDSTQRKYFYISPFIALDVDLRLRLAVPGERLGIVIDDLQDGRHLLRASMTGKRVPLTPARLAWFSIKYPLLTVKVIAAIHWQAVRLWLKGVPFLRKGDRPDLQRGHSRAEVRP
ncbi:MAG: DUF1365 domain-containing protein [Acidobacteriota bacterium]